MTDLDLIYSWTPREFTNFKKGALLRRVDETETAVMNAILSGGISRSKERNLNPKKYFDAEKARKEILEDSTKKKPLQTDLFKKATKALKNLFTPKNDT